MGTASGRRHARGWGFGVWASGVLLVLAACGRPEPPVSRAPTPLVVVAVDALDEAGVRRLAASGEAPALARLLEGRRAPLETERASEAMVVWGEVVTGRSWRRNGLYQAEVPTAEEGWLLPRQALVPPASGPEDRRLRRGLLERPEVALPALEFPLRELVQAGREDVVSVQRACREGKAGLRAVRLRQPGLGLLYLGPLESSDPGGDPRGRELALEILGALEGHLTRLEECGGPGVSVLLVAAARGAPLHQPRSLTLDLEALLAGLGYLEMEQGPGGRSQRRVDRARSQLRVLSPRRQWPDYARPLFMGMNPALVEEAQRGRFLRGAYWTLRQLRTEATGASFFREVEMVDLATAPEAAVPVLMVRPDPQALRDDVVVRGGYRARMLEELVFRYEGLRGAAVGPGVVLAGGPAFRPGDGDPVRPVDLRAIIRAVRGGTPEEGGEGRVPEGFLAPAGAVLEDGT